MKFFTLPAVLTLLVLASGCANEGPAYVDKRKPSAKSEIEKALASVELSPDLALTNPLAGCDAAAAVKDLDREIDIVAAKARELWDACQAVFACSPITSEALRAWFESGASFRLGFADLKAFNLPNLGGKLRGLYLGGGRSIYLDKGLKTPRLACHLLLHELVHRFDPEAHSGEESLRTEYKAYWYQAAFNDELSPLMNQGGGMAASANFHTRESLLAGVSEVYGFTPDMSLVKRYRPLPREAAALKSSLDPPAQPDPRP